MEKVTGSLKSLGVGAVSEGQSTKYSVIEIDDRVLQGISAVNAMDTYLQRALKDTDPVTLWITESKSLWGVELSNGKRYVRKDNPHLGPVGSCIMGLLTLPIFGLGLFRFLIYFIGSAHSEYKAILELQNQGKDIILLEA